MGKIKSTVLQWTITRHDFIKSKNKMFLTFCFCFILGASGFSFLNNSRALLYLYGFAFLLLFLIIICWSKQWIRFFSLCILVFVLGGCRFLITIPETSPKQIHFYNGEKLLVQGFVAKEPDMGIGDVQYIVQVNQLKINNNWQAVSGNIMLKTRFYPQYAYGEFLQIDCSLQAPKNFEDSRFNYVKYLAKQDVWSICGNPKIKSLGENKGNFLMSIILQFKNKIQSQMSRLWPEPDNSLLAGILYGSRSGLPDDLADNFSRTGVSHIVAVSGYNVTIIIVALHSILIYLGFFRRQSFWLLVFLIIVFVLFTGASASVLRAGVMALLVLVSQHIGRLSAIDRVLIYAAVVMLLFNPYLLIWDAGFQLSFLATIGLVYISPMLQKLFDKKIKINNSFMVGIVEVFLTTMSAIVATLPLILYQFGRFSVSAPFVNILILWIMPFLMLFGFIALILSALFFPIGQIVAWFAWVGTRYVIMVVNWFGRQSWSAFDMRISGWVMAVLYLLMVLVVVRNSKKTNIYV